MRLFGIAFLLAGIAVVAWAGPPATPEIDTNSGLAALAVLTGGLLILRARRKQK